MVIIFMRIIKRKKGKKEYFYLQHSFRKNKEVITREIYLGKAIPKDIEGLKEKLAEEEKNSIYEKLEKIKKDFQREWSRYPESIKEKEKEEIAIAFTYNTNAIEGSKITLEETRGIIKDNISPSKSLRDVKETEAHYNLFLKMLSKKNKITNKLILEWHKELFKETKEEIAGKYRDYLVRVGDYTAPDWQDVKKLMRKFVNLVNNSKINPVELAGRAHYVFESIHPFGDGNGRIGRLVMNHILWHSGYPMLIIERRKRSPYYKAFKRGEEGFVNYFIRRYLSAHKNRLKN